MSKINFNKVEQTLEEGLRQYGVKQLLFLADLAASFGVGRSKKSSAFDDIETKFLFLQSLLRNIQTLKKKDFDIDQKLGIDKKKMKYLLKNPKEITGKEWEIIKEIRRKLDLYRRETRSKGEKVSNEDIVASERKKQKNKRFNIKDQWLPLH